MTENKPSLLVLFGGISPEHEVSCRSAAAVLRAVDKEKYRVLPMGLTKEGAWILTQASPEVIEAGAWEHDASSERAVISPDRGIHGIVAEKQGQIHVDCIFPVIHGETGEDGSIQGLFKLAGIPFVGPAGHLLDDMLQMIDLDRSKVYIANIVKCRPPGNRDPLGIEQDACWQWLERQIALVQPRIIVCLGRIAAMKIIKEDFRITREHGQWFDIDQRRVMATFHPSALLRDQSKRPNAFMDLRALRKEIKAVCDGVY